MPKIEPARLMGGPPLASLPPASKMKRIHMWLPYPTWIELQRVATWKNITTSDLIRRMIYHCLSDLGGS